jgi:SAM-dependent methyltransferase
MPIPDYLPPGWLTPEEADLLDRMAGLCEGPILEVGCYKGRSTVLLASYGRPVYCVDPFSDFCKADLSGDQIEAEFRRNTAHLPNIKLFRQTVETWTPRDCGLCYLDGNHTYQGTVSQIKIAQFCRPQWIAVHDVNDRGGGKQVKQACLDLLGPWHERVGRLATFRVASTVKAGGAA